MVENVRRIKLYTQGKKHARSSILEKEDILKSLTVLETDELLPMVEDLPEDITALIATQIDPVKFAEILCDDFSDVIASCGVNV